MPHALPGSGPAPVPRRAAFTLVELLVVVAIIAVLLGILLPVTSRMRESSNRAKCLSNLRSIGQALASYAEQNKGDFPRTYYDPKKALNDAYPEMSTPQGMKFAKWGVTAANPFVPPDPSNPSNPANAGPPRFNNIAAAIFLLLRTQDMPPDAFICPSTDAAPDNFGRDKPGGAANALAKRHSNFTELPNTAGVPSNLSYSYANPYPGTGPGAASYRLTGTMAPDFVIGADLNPGKQGTYDVTAPNESSAASDLRKANSSNHRGAGQNVLYADGHVTFEQTPFCGRLHDNIYTVGGSADGSVPTSTTIVGSPAWSGDSVLLPAEGK